ncbi:MAG: cation transporter [Bacteroidales bacterium]|nr:cation transporter [Bacteroidales bacterium]
MKEHHNHHHHHHEIDVNSLNKAFILGITLNVAYVLVEFGFGLYSHSMGLISDAGHNLIDIVSLVLALLAFRLLRIHTSKKYTYGLKKSTILVSLVNAVILLIVVGGIVVESVHKLITPVEVQGGIIAWVAAIGVLINGFTAWLFIKDKERDINVKGAYLHMAADALMSLAVVVSGIVIYYTHWYFVDPVIGIIVAVVITFSTWKLLKQSLRLSLDGVPDNVEYDVILHAMESHPSVVNVHHMHVWALSTTENALTAHVVLQNYDHAQAVKQELKHRLHDLGINHATIELEHEGELCTHAECRHADE